VIILPVEASTRSYFDLFSAALIIIDMQNDFLLEDAPIYCTGGLAAVVGIEKLARYFRANNRPVIFTQEAHRKQRVDFGLELAYEEPEHCLEGSFGVHVMW
jgi:nicotinamidase-related amidase